MSNQFNLDRAERSIAPASIEGQDNNNASADLKKQYQVIINLQAYVLTGQWATYQEIAHKAFPADPVSPDITYTITYTNPNGPDGDLRDGEKVKLHEGMVFVVGKSNRS